MNRFWCPLFADSLERNNMNYFIRIEFLPPAKVMLSVVSIHQSFYLQGVPVSFLYRDLALAPYAKGLSPFCIGTQPWHPLYMVPVPLCTCSNLDFTVHGLTSSPKTCSTLFTMKNRLLDAGCWYSTEMPSCFKMDKGGSKFASKNYVGERKKLIKQKKSYLLW